MTISGNNVGIGVTNPLTKLDIRGPNGRYSNDNVRLSIGMSNLICAQIAGIDTSTPPGIGTWRGDMAFYTQLNDNMIERMRIDSAGNVGIGTGTPEARLDVSGRFQVSSPGVGTDGGDAFINFKTGTGDMGYIYLDDTTNNFIITN
jgi:hypothetical protein